MLDESVPYSSVPVNRAESFTSSSSREPGRDSSYEFGKSENDDGSVLLDSLLAHREITRNGTKLSPLQLTCSAPSYGSPTWRFDGIVTNRVQLEKFVSELQFEPLTSLDTETYGMGSEPLNARLSLIQIGIPTTRGARVTGGRTILIDVVALCSEAERDAVAAREPSRNPLAPLAYYLESDRHIKVVQQASFEREQFARYGIALKGITDTLERSRTLVPRLPSHSLQAQCVEYLGLSMSKHEQKSGWGRRPLLDRHVEYARLDPEITFKVWQKQESAFGSVEINKLWSAERQLIELGKVLATRFSLESRMLPKIVEGTAFIKAVKEYVETELGKVFENLESTESSEEERAQRELLIKSMWGSCRVTQGSSSYPDAVKLAVLLPDVAAQIVKGKVGKTECAKAFKDLGYKAKEFDEILPDLLAEPRVTHAFEVVLDKRFLLNHHKLLKPAAPIYKSAYPVVVDDDLAEFLAQLQDTNTITCRPILGENGFSGLLQFGLDKKVSSGSENSEINVWIVNAVSNDIGDKALLAVKNRLANGGVLLIENKTGISKVLSRFVTKESTVYDVSKKLSQSTGLDMGTTVSDWSLLYSDNPLDPRDDVRWHQLLQRVHASERIIDHKIGEFISGLDFSVPDLAVELALSEIVLRQQEILDVQRPSISKLAKLRAQELALLDSLEQHVYQSLSKEVIPTVQTHSGRLCVELRTKVIQEIDPTKLRSLYPKIVEAIESVKPTRSIGSFTRSDLRDALKSIVGSGTSAALRESVIDECFLTVPEKEPRVTISPNVQLLYQPDMEV